MSEKYTFQDFLKSVEDRNQAFVINLQEGLAKLGCKTEVKLAKSGYVVSYSLDKRTIANYVSRKKGLMARIYADHVAQDRALLDSLPEGMVQAIQKALACKRLADPAACNPRCPMGYDFILKGERLQRCRNSAFMFLLSEENKPYVQELLLSEAMLCASQSDEH